MSDNIEKSSGNIFADLELEKAEELTALAKVGITALIDEATGFQDTRDNNALRKILVNLKGTKRIRLLLNTRNRMT